jgi:hypothetical protein
MIARRRSEMKYNVIALRTEDNDYIWCVMEQDTEQLIRAFEFEDDADSYCEFLSAGGAFDGFTPSFILQEVANYRDINREFSAILHE